MKRLRRSSLILERTLRMWGHMLLFVSNPTKGDWFIFGSMEALTEFLTHPDFQEFSEGSEFVSVNELLG